MMTSTSCANPPPSYANPTPSYTRDPAETTVRQVLRHVLQPWTLDFLYPSKNAHIEQFQQVLQTPHRVTANSSVSTVIPSDGLSLNETIRVLIFPSLSVGSLSVSHLVTEMVSTSVSLHKKPRIGRLVRNDERGILFRLTQMDTGMTEVTIVAQHSQCFQERIFMIVVTEPFRTVMCTLAKDDFYDEEMMRKALIYASQFRHIRACPKCGKSVGCHCELTLIRKRHPVDFDADIAIYASFMGSFSGDCHHSMYDGGVNVYKELSSVSVRASYLYGGGERRNLESWAYWDTLHGRENLSNLALPEVRIDTQVAEHVREGEDEDGISYKRPQPTGRPEQPEVPQPSHAAIPLTVHPVRQPQPTPDTRETSTPLKKDAFTVPKRRGRPPFPTKRRPTHPVQIAPAKIGTAPVDIGKAVDNQSDEAGRKLGLQKVRNREFAHRSNERKKKQIQELEDNLEEAKKKKESLLEKEKNLKEENQELRKKLTD